MKTKKTKKANLELSRSRFFLIGLVFALAVTLSAFEWRTIEKNDNIGIGCFDIPNDWIETDEVYRIPKPKLPEVKVPEKKSPNLNPVEKIIEHVEGNEPIDDFPEIDDDLDFGDEEGTVQEDVLPKEPLTYAEVMPKFNCSDNATEEFYRYIQQNVRYPQKAKSIGESGIVYVDFVVDTNGKIKKVKAKNHIGGGCSEEAERVVRSMPDWCPGKQGNKNVAVKMVLPVNFSLKN